MIGIQIDKVKMVQKLFDADIKKQQSLALEKLQRIDTKLFNLAEIEYLTNVIKYFGIKNFIAQEPDQIDIVKRELGKIPPNSRVDSNGKYMKPLKHFIQDALGYESLRSRFYPTYFSKIGINSCIYCNAQLTVTIRKQNGVYIGRFDVDHFRSKDAYPLLCISLFNLYPSCTSCNRLKSDKEVLYDIYTNRAEDLKTSKFEFKLNSHSKAKYLLNKDCRIIDFTFESRMPNTSNAIQEVFHVKEIYETQKDIIEELIVKSQIYNQVYKDQLRKSFSLLSLDDKKFERVLIGNYTEEIDIHKRPMSKFMMDIARDLGII